MFNGRSEEEICANNRFCEMLSRIYNHAKCIATQGNCEGFGNTLRVESILGKLQVSPERGYHDSDGGSLLVPAGY
jgi:hypothetical protein